VVSTPPEPFVQAVIAFLGPRQSRFSFFFSSLSVVPETTPRDRLSFSFSPPSLTGLQQLVGLFRKMNHSCPFPRLNLVTFTKHSIFPISFFFFLCMTFSIPFPPLEKSFSLRIPSPPRAPARDFNVGDPSTFPLSQF